MPPILNTTVKKFPLAQIESDEENWDDIEIPSSGLMVTDNTSEDDIEDVGKIPTNDMSGITIVDSDDDAENILRSTIAFDQKPLFTSTNKNPPHLLDDISSSSKIIQRNVQLNAAVKAMIGDLNNSLSSKEFTGTITMLGNPKKVVDMDDWDNDMEIPEDGLSFSDPSKSSIKRIDNPSTFPHISTEKVVESGNDIMSGAFHSRDSPNDSLKNSSSGSLRDSPSGSLRDSPSGSLRDSPS
ncbi:18767_t:CDS:2, partial [Gigaspora rosea]